MKNSDLIRHMNYCLEVIQAYEGSDEPFVIQDFVDAVDQLNSLIKVYTYFKNKDEALMKIGQKVVGY